MSKSNYENQLRVRIDEVLYYLWDPIGVCGVAVLEDENHQIWPRDEYATYVDQIWRDVLEGKSKEQISSYLTYVTTELMGMDSRKNHDDIIAGIILQWAKILKKI